MTIQHMILYILYACSFISLNFIPKSKWREASIIFLSQQLITWFLGLLIVELHFIEYPIRELSKVNRSSFVYEFLLFPLVSVFFCIYFPTTKAKWYKLLYISAFCTGISVPEVTFEKYTNLIHYIHWGWYFTWLSTFSTLVLVYIFYKWYFKLKIL